jgi:FdhD protein
VHAPAFDGADTLRFDAALLNALPGTVRAQQRVFGATGGLHAAALFDSAGALLALLMTVAGNVAADAPTWRGLDQLTDDERMVRDARVLTIGGGATEVMLEEVAKRM